jgi:hypothetical protein
MWEHFPRGRVGRSICSAIPVGRGSDKPPSLEVYLRYKSDWYLSKPVLGCCGAGGGINEGVETLKLGVAR